MEELVNEAALRLIPKKHRAQVEVTRALIDNDQQVAFSRGLWNFESDAKTQKQIRDSQKRQYRLVLGKDKDAHKKKLKNKTPKKKKIVDLD